MKSWPTRWTSFSDLVDESAAPFVSCDIRAIILARDDWRSESQPPLASAANWRHLRASAKNCIELPAQRSGDRN
jgi:hypothetical protein